MKKLIIASVAIAVISLQSCKKDPGATGATGATGPAGPSLSGTVEGYVDLFDQYGGLVSPVSGVSVTIPGKSGADSTSSNGMFTKSLTTGTYELDFAKNGYGAEKIVSLNFVGGGTQYVQNHVQMTQPPTFAITQMSVSVGTGTVNPTVIATVTTSTTDTKPRKVICFFGKSPSVSYSPNAYLGSQLGVVSIGSSSVTVNFTPQTLNPAGVFTGDTLYLIAYPISYNANASTYADMTTGKTIFNNLNTLSPVATQSIVAP